MMQKNSSNSTDHPIITKIIHFSFLALFFITPLLLSIKSTELFEFPKMLFVYAITVIIAGSWILEIILSGKLVWKKSWLDPILIFILLTQLLSSFISLDRYTSFYGYYSRFHGGFWSTLCYVLLAFAFIRFCQKSWTKDILLANLASASLVSLYAIAEHFGIDAAFWVQDVQNRVFSTLGQPNWLAAWLGALLPFAYQWFLKPPKSFWPTAISLNIFTIIASYGLTFAATQTALPISGTPFFLFILFYATFNGLILYRARWLHEKLRWLSRFNFLFLIILMQLALLFTRSRSGILAMIISTIIFIIAKIITLRNVKILIPLTLITVFLILIVGTEWTPNLTTILGKGQQKVKNPLTVTQFNPKITESTDIRKVVWEGALRIWQHYPLFGAGTETFAYSYYNFRSVEHNKNSEWDFLYNKAHNEYLNFLANNGSIGTSAILLLFVAVIALVIGNQIKSWFITGGILFIAGGLFYGLKPDLIKIIIDKLLIYPPLLLPLGISFLIAIGFWLILNKYYQLKKDVSSLDCAILAAFVSIFITNFYGFSVVNVALLYFILPATLVISKQQSQIFIRQIWQPAHTQQVSLKILGLSAGVILICFSLLVSIIQYYQADRAYNYSENYLRMGNILESGKEIDTALQLHPGNANFWLQKGLVSAQTAFVVSYKDASDSSGLVNYYTQQAALNTQKALLQNPVHINLYKSAARVYITLGLIDPKYVEFAINTLAIAQKLSPTDPQIFANMALLKQQQGKYEEAEVLFKKAIELKPDYLQGVSLLAQMYEEEKDYVKAASVYQYILDRIDHKETTSLKKLEEFKTKK